MIGVIGRYATPGVELPKVDNERRFFIDITKTNTLRVQLQLNPFHLARGLTFRILRIMGEDDNNILEIKYHFTNKLVVNQDDKEILISKGKIQHNDWNLVSILINFEKNLLQLHVNGETSETTKYNKKLNEGFHTLSLCKTHKEHAHAFYGLIKNLVIDSGDEISPEYKDKPKHKSIFAEPMNLPICSPKELHHWKPDEMADRFQIVKIPLQKSYKRKKDKPQVLICHDFANGYVLDNVIYGFDTLSMNYRFLHWNHLDIYIHFTHYFLGFPAPQITNLAHRFGAKSLGVLCTEWEQGAKNNITLLSGMAEDEDGELRFKGKFYYADKLVEICKYYGFDGYLLNIESNNNIRVENAYQLAEWVSYLTKKMHEEVPGGIIMWYDSVILNGEVRWQSMVNEANRIFFDASDYFFTDYHWAEQKLMMSAQNAGHEINKLFTGIDCCGRGAYMGGQFNSYMGVKKVTELNSSVALFGQGWTAMDNYGYASWELFHRNDERLWMGRDYAILASHEARIEWKEDLTAGQGWGYSKIEGGLKETISTASFDFCMRSITIDLANLKIDLGAEQSGILIFDFQVRGVGPKVEDPWICVMEALDANGNVILSKDSAYKQLQYEKNTMIDPRFNKDCQKYINAATGDWVQHKIEIYLRDVHQNIRKNIRFIRCSEAGKDLEYWAGHFGPQFKGEIVSLSKGYDPSKSILKIIGTRRNISLPIHTYFNEGHGEAMYIEGIKQDRPKKYYNCPGDIDTNFGYYSSQKRYKFFDSEDKLLGSFKMVNDQPWNGGSSMRLIGDINSGSVQTYKLYKTEFEVSSLTILLCVTNLHSDLAITPFLRDKNKNLTKFKQEKGVRKNGWIYYRYEVAFETPTCVRGLYFYLENTSQKMVNYYINFGEFSIYEGKTWNESIKDIDLKKTNELIKSFDARMTPQNLLDREKPSTKRYYSVQFELNMSQSNHLLVKYYQIFRNDVWIVNSTTPLVHIENAQIDKERTFDEFKIQFVLLNGRKNKLADIEPYVVVYDEISKY